MGEDERDLTHWGGTTRSRFTPPVPGWSCRFVTYKCRVVRRFFEADSFRAKDEAVSRRPEAGMPGRCAKGGPALRA